MPRAGITNPRNFLFAILSRMLRELLAINDDQLKLSATLSGAFTPDTGTIGGVVEQNDFGTALGAYSPDSLGSDFGKIQNSPPPNTAPA